MGISLVFDEKYLQYRPSFLHFYHPLRVQMIIEYLKEVNLWKSENVAVVQPDFVEEDTLQLGHAPSYINYVKQLSKEGVGSMADHTIINENTFECSKSAVGGAVKAGRLIFEDRTNSFALVRPPGHHAARTYGGGYCLVFD